MDEKIKEHIIFLLEDDNKAMTAALAPDKGAEAAVIALFFSWTGDIF